MLFYETSVVRSLRIKSFPQRFRLVRLLPLHAEFLSAHVTVGGKRVILRLLQLQLGDDGVGAAVEYLIDRVGDRFVAVLGGAERVHHDGNGLGYADGIGELYLTFFGNAGCDHVFGDVARIVCRAAVNLCRVLAAERAAAVTGKAAVGVNNDLSAGQTRVADGAADDESAGGIDKNLGIP